MRLPFLQVAQEAWDYARQLAALSGRDEAYAYFAINNLWRWGLTLGPEDQAPTGICEKPRATKLLLANIGPGWEPEVIDHLADLDLVELLADGAVRVKGMDRYAAAWGKAQKDKERKRIAREKAKEKARLEAESGRPSDGARTSVGRREEAPRKTHTQTHIKNKTSSLPPPLPNPPEEPPSNAKPEEEEGSSAHWERQARELRADKRPGLLPEHVPKETVHDFVERAVRHVREEHRVDRAEAWNALSAAWVAYLGDDDFAGSGWLLRVFMTDEVWKHRIRIGSGERSRGSG